MSTTGYKLNVLIPGSSIVFRLERKLEYFYFFLSIFCLLVCQLGWLVGHLMVG